jgi:hypothetical protein
VTILDLNDVDGRSHRGGQSGQRNGLEKLHFEMCVYGCFLSRTRFGS